MHLYFIRQFGLVRHFTKILILSSGSVWILLLIQNLDSNYQTFCECLGSMLNTLGSI